MSRRLKIAFLSAIAGLLVAGCINDGSLLHGSAALMHYQSKPTEARLQALAKSYAEAINHNLEQQTPHPGQYADYGVVLARLGCKKQANVMFNNEKMLFPNSTLYVDALKQRLSPEYADERQVDTSKIELWTLDTIHIVLTPEEEALQRQLENDPEYKRMMKQRQQEERKRQAEARRAEKKKQKK